MVAHPSRNEVLRENGLADRPLGPFAEKVVHILQGKYYQRGGKVYGRKML
jgi:hypothetical protein